MLKFDPRGVLCIFLGGGCAAGTLKPLPYTGLDTEKPHPIPDLVFLSNCITMAVFNGKTINNFLRQ